MWVARRDACIRLPRRSRVPRCPLGIQPDLQDCRATCDSTRQGWMMLGQGKGEKGEKRSEGKEGGEKWIVPGGLGYRIRPVDRATFYPKVLRAAYATLECNRYRDQCFDLRTTTRSYGGWIFIRNAGERERESARFRRGNRASSYETGGIPFRESEKGSIKFASYAIARERTSSFD